METRVFRPDERAEWNSVIAAHPYGHVLQSWEWGELKSRTGWRADRIALQSAGEIRAAAQILIRALPGGAGKVAYIPKGPVLDYEDHVLLGSVLATLRARLAPEGVISLKLEPEVREPSSVPGQLRAWGLTPAQPVQMRSTLWVDLACEEDALLGSFKQKTRYNIRLAAKKGVTVSSGGVADLDSWYRIFEATAERDIFTIHGLGYYRQILQVLGANDMARLLLAHHDGDLLAGIIVFRFGRFAQYMYGASSNSKRNLMAPYLLQWEAMRWARAHGCTTYDLWGIPDHLEETEDLWGVYRHKRGYNGDLVRYIGAYDMVNAPWRHFALERVARPLFKRVARLAVQGSK